jgi:hypothetical protein
MKLTDRHERAIKDLQILGKELRDKARGISALVFTDATLETKVGILRAEKACLQMAHDLRLLTFEVQDAERGIA